MKPMDDDSLRDEALTPGEETKGERRIGSWISDAKIEREQNRMRLTRPRCQPCFRSKVDEAKGSSSC